MHWFTYNKKFSFQANWYTVSADLLGLGKAMWEEFLVSWKRKNKNKWYNPNNWSLMGTYLGVLKQYKWTQNIKPCSLALKGMLFSELSKDMFIKILLLFLGIIQTMLLSSSGKFWRKYRKPKIFLMSLVLERSKR